MVAHGNIKSSYWSYQCLSSDKNCIFPQQHEANKRYNCTLYILIREASITPKHIRIFILLKVYLTQLWTWKYGQYEVPASGPRVQKMGGVGIVIQPCKVYHCNSNHVRWERGKMGACSTYHVIVIHRIHLPRIKLYCSATPCTWVRSSSLHPLVDRRPAARRELHLLHEIALATLPNAILLLETPCPSVHP